MTDAEELEELEYLRLKAKAAKAQPAANAEAATAYGPEPSRAAAALAGVQNLGTLGWGDELGAALQGALAKATGTGEFGETYRQARGENRHESAAAKAAHPGYYYGAGAPAALASSIAMPGLKAAQGAGLGLRALVGAGNGALQGAVAGAGDSEAETAGDVAKDALKGGALGGTVGAVLPVAGGAARALLRGVVKPSAAAQELARLGVDTSKLTLGQLNPEGAMAQIEEAGQHAIGSGNVIRGQREAGTQAWRDAVLKKATAPGWGLGPKGDTADKLAGAYETFKPAYEQIGAHAIESAGPGQQSIGDQLRKAFQGAVEDQGVLATDADRAAIGKYLQNQASALKLQPGQASTVGDLQAVRGTVRKDLAQALSGASPNYSSAKLLKNAERALSEHIEQNLPTRAQGLLRDTDARYALYKTVEDAVGRAGDKAEGLMPTHLSAAVKAATENGAYARGGGGELRELAAAGREALQAKSPPTGVRALMQAIPGSHYVQSPVAAVANMDAPKRALLGQTKPQLAMQALADALGLGSETAAQTATASGRQLPLLLQYLRQGGGSPSMSSAAQASDEDRAHQAALAQALASGGNR